MAGVGLPNTREGLEVVAVREAEEDSVFGVGGGGAGREVIGMGDIGVEVVLFSLSLGNDEVTSSSFLEMPPSLRPRPSRKRTVADVK